MLNNIKKVLFFIFFIFYFYSISYAITINDNNALLNDPNMSSSSSTSSKSGASSCNYTTTSRDRILEKKIERHNFNEEVKKNKVTISNEFEVECKFNKNTSAFIYINNNIDFLLNNEDISIYTKNELDKGYIKLSNNKYGSISCGKNISAIRDTFNLTKSLVYNSDLSESKSFMCNKSSNLLLYESNNLLNNSDNDLNFKLQLQGKNKTLCLNPKEKFIETGNGKGYGFSINFNRNNFKMSASHFLSERTEDQNLMDSKQFKNKYAKLYAISAKCNYKNFSLSGLYSITNYVLNYGNIRNTYITNLYKKRSTVRRYYPCGFSKDSRTIELLTKYKFDNGICPSIGFFRSFAKTLNHKKGRLLCNFVTFGSSYKYKKALVFVDYKFNLLEKTRFNRRACLNTKNDLYIGLKYKF